MGHRKQSAPRHGSLAFRPRARAGDIFPRIRSWVDINNPKPIVLGFTGFKAGMIHVIITGDNPRTSTIGKPLFRAATVVAAPAMMVCGIRLYGRSVHGEHALIEVYSDKLPKVYELALPKGYFKSKFDVNILDKFVEKTMKITVIVGSEPSLASLPQKKPRIFEIEIGGGKSIQERLSYAKSILGNKLSVGDVFKAGEYVDAIGITRGKGFQGVVKRFGVKKKQHKSRKSVRAIGVLGPWHPAAVTYTTPRAGQMGFHKRTEYNKRLLRVGSTSQGMTFNPSGGFFHFGKVSGDYIIVDGSIEGTPKRPIVFRFAIRKTAEKPTTPKIVEVSISPVEVRGS